MVAHPPDLDDGLLGLEIGSPSLLVQSLAWFKAAQVGPPTRGAFATVAADTVCVVGDEVLGKPRDRGHAQAMLTSILGGSHHTYSGVCVLDRKGRRWLFGDSAAVSMDSIEPSDLEAYLDSGEWQGKAGGYNLVDRQAAGWPVVCEGDPSTVMGLPLKMLVPFLRRIEGEASDDR